ncbi:MAG: LysM peptidoglycan-binding domain-containing protein [Cryomorphaceae bacterium]|nr:MAG: LysM peptidoglycan-binding domain-containing protein [Cryomorphaceae bacterium]
MISAPNHRPLLNGNSLRAILLVAVLLLSAVAFGQETRRVDGQRYTVHVVEKGHTLFAISRQYSVSVETILQHNPEARAGLLIGDEIVIPASEVDRKAARDNPPEMDGKFLNHKVERKETLFSISRKYNVDVNSILEHNPEADKGLQIGETLRIYVGDVEVKDEQIIQPAEPDSLLRHFVEPGQTLYSIARQYEISVEEITAVNDGLPEGLKAGMMLRIPLPNPEFVMNAPAKADTLIVTDDFPALTGARSSYRVALMLPFSADLQDSIFKNLDPTSPLAVNALTDIAVEIYRGFRIAADSLAAQGMNVDLYLYDVGEAPVDIQQAMSDPQLGQMHLIVGPLHRTSFEKVEKFAASRGIHIVSPVANQMLRTNYPTSCVLHASYLDQMRFLGRYVARMHLNDNVVVVDSDKFKDHDYLQYFLQSYQGNFRGDTIQPVKLDKFGIESVKSKLVSGKKNIIVVPSMDLGFVSDLMNRLSNIKSGDYDLVVMGMEKWMDYHNVDMQYKNRFNLTIPATTFLNFDREDHHQFTELYAQAFNRPPGNGGYAFMGFDVGWYFLGAMKKYGLDFPDHFDTNTYRGLYMGFHMARQSNGCRNNHIYLLQYNDYQVQPIN